MLRIGNRTTPAVVVAGATLNHAERNLLTSSTASVSTRTTDPVTKAGGSAHGTSLRPSQPRGLRYTVASVPLTSTAADPSSATSKPSARSRSGAPWSTVTVRSTDVIASTARAVVTVTTGPATGVTRQRPSPSCTAGALKIADQNLAVLSALLLTSRISVITLPPAEPRR